MNETGEHAMNANTLAQILFNSDASRSDEVPVESNGYLALAGWERAAAEAGDTQTSSDIAVFRGLAQLEQQFADEWERLYAEHFGACYRISYSDGRTVHVASFDAAIEVLEAEYPELSYGHGGDLKDGGDRALCWAYDADGRDDDGIRAVASIHHDE
jgi:hypothetical protein